jgi:hypothetical protein
MDRFLNKMDGRIGKLVQWGIIIFAVIYFSPVIWTIFTR